ncbi:MAG TPA: helix-turn-helix domain-containing protein [Rhodocyclaceae bacterium]|jgi:transcriptional regulator with XRE-family HTH domain|nr:helix-turn-helix domain-containing protein [Rhodocyclaceae bacterium]
MSTRTYSQALLAHLVAQRLQTLRRRRGLSIESLAGRLSPFEPEAMAARIRRLERTPTRPDLELVARIAGLYDVPVASLLAPTALESACYILLARLPIRQRVAVWRSLVRRYQRLQPGKAP